MSVLNICLISVLLEQLTTWLEKKIKFGIGQSNVLQLKV